MASSDLVSSFLARPARESRDRGYNQSEASGEKAKRQGRTIICKERGKKEDEEKRSQSEVEVGGESLVCDHL